MRTRHWGEDEETEVNIIDLTNTPKQAVIPMTHCPGWARKEASKMDTLGKSHAILKKNERQMETLSCKETNLTWNFCVTVDLINKIREYHLYPNKTINNVILGIEGISLTSKDD